MRALSSMPVHTRLANRLLTKGLPSLSAISLKNSSVLTSASTALSGSALATRTPSIQPATNFCASTWPSGVASMRESQTITSKIRLVAVFVEYTTCAPLTARCASARSGSQSTAASTLPDSKAARTPVVPSSALMKTVLTLSFLRAVIDEFSMASISMPCEGVNCSSATERPARSSIDLIAGSRAITASPPWVLSTIITARPSRPALRRFGCSCAQKSEVRHAHCAVPASKIVDSVGMSSWMRNSTLTLCLAYSEPGCVFRLLPFATSAGA